MHFNPDGLDQEHKDTLRNGAMFFVTLVGWGIGGPSDRLIWSR